MGCDPTSVGVTGGQPGGRAVESGLEYGKLSFVPFHWFRVLLGHCGGVAWRVSGSGVSRQSSEGLRQRQQGWRPQG